MRLVPNSWDILRKRYPLALVNGEGWKVVESRSQDIEQKGITSSWLDRIRCRGGGDEDGWVRRESYVAELG